MYWFFVVFGIGRQEISRNFRLLDGATELPPIYSTRILSKHSSQVVSRKIRHLVALRIGMNKMAEDDEYLDYIDETLERVGKPWSALLGAFLETKWRVLNSLKHPHRTGRGKMGNPQLYLFCVSSLLSLQQPGAR